jgi:hypothetical protein
MNSKPSPASIIIMASGAVMLLFSFFDWFEAGGFSVNAWSGDGVDSFPLFTYVPVFGALCAALIAAKTFGNVNLPANIAGFTVTQVLKALGIFCVLLVIGIWIAFGGDGIDTGIGLWLSLLGSIGLVVGAFMLDNEPASSAPQGPSTPF